MTPVIRPPWFVDWLPVWLRRAPICRRVWDRAKIPVWNRVWLRVWDRVKATTR